MRTPLKNRKNRGLKFSMPTMMPIQFTIYWLLPLSSHLPLKNSIIQLIMNLQYTQLMSPNYMVSLMKKLLSSPNSIRQMQTMLRLQPLSYNSLQFPPKKEPLHQLIITNAKMKQPNNFSYNQKNNLIYQKYFQNRH